MNEQLKNYINMVDGCMDSTLVEPEDNAAWLIVKHTLEESIDAALASPADALVAGDSETAKDTERLDFVLENGVPMMRNGEYRFHGFPGKWFKTDREAIDFAIQAQKDGHG